MVAIPAIGPESIPIPGGYDMSDDPICVTKTAFNNDCLDDGNYIDLTLTIMGTVSGVAIAADCDEAHVSVFDDEGKFSEMGSDSYSRP